MEKVLPAALVVVAVVVAVCFVVRGAKSKAVPPVKAEEEPLPPIPSAPRPKKAASAAKPEFYQEKKLDLPLLAHGEEGGEEDQVRAYAYDLSAKPEASILPILRAAKGKDLKIKEDEGGFGLYYEATRLCDAYQNECGREMIADFIQRGRTVAAMLTGYDFAVPTMSFRTGFYLPVSELPAYECPLSGLRKKDYFGEPRYRNFAVVDEGAEIYASCSDFTVYADGMAHEIGELPTLAQKWLAENEARYAVGYLQTVEYSPDDYDCPKKAIVKIWPLKQK